MKLSENEIREKLSKAILPFYVDIDSLIDSINTAFGKRLEFKKPSETITPILVPKIPFKKFEQLEIIKFTDKMATSSYMPFNYIKKLDEDIQDNFSMTIDEKIKYSKRPCKTVVMNLDQMVFEEMETMLNLAIEENKKATEPFKNTLMLWSLLFHSNFSEN